MPRDGGDRVSKICEVIVWIMVMAAMMKVQCDDDHDDDVVAIIIYVL